MVWTQEQADAALESDMSQFMAGVQSLCNAKGNQLAALADFAFNLGLRSLMASTLLKLYRAGDIKGAADQFPKWVFARGRKLPGLMRRRCAEERELFLA